MLGAQKGASRAAAGGPEMKGATVNRVEIG